MKIAARVLFGLLVVAALVGSISLGAAPAPQEQVKLDPDGKANYGEVKLEAGFAPDPFKKNLEAGGKVQVKVNGIEMFVEKTPDFKLFYKAGGIPLTIWVDSEADTTLLINLPDGKWFATDDSENGKNHNPVAKFEKAQSGRYDIYVGTIGPKAAKAVLHITELK